ncbi:MAG: hypothetical protein JWQ88_3478 [Rhodoferax sp.]|nr:hypothetical protein [Rhodoferax sp.]
MQPVSIHVVDVANGVVASGMRIDLFRRADHAGDGESERLADRLEGPDVDRHGSDAPWALVLSSAVGPSGVVDGIEAHPQALTTGTYEVRLHVADYYRARGMALPPPAFMEVQVFRFAIADVAQHCHLPVKLTAWGLSCFRGAA